MRKRIMAGTLSMRFRKGQEHFGSAIDAASRENRKRTFSVINRVLGKHCPVRPSYAREVFDELALECKSPHDTLVVGVAEMAIGFGGCIADSLKKNQSSGTVFFQHTTRQSAVQPIWFKLREAHSHAADHLFYAPSIELFGEVVTCKHLVLVDDEITTGKTMIALVRALLDRMSSVKLVTIVTLANWMPQATKIEFDRLGPHVRCVSLVEGEFDFLADPKYTSELPRYVDSVLNDTPCSFDAGRAGVEVPILTTNPDAKVFESSDPLLVMGMSENTFLPFLAAERLEKSDRAVLFQSTTRSPLALGDAIKSKRSFFVGREKLHFVYNEPEGYVSYPMFESTALRDECSFSSANAS